MHVENSGLQAHSIGETYPWTVVVQGDAERSGDECFAFNGETGEEGLRYHTGEGQDRLPALMAAEDDCMTNKRRDEKRHRKHSVLKNRIRAFYEDAA